MSTKTTSARGRSGNSGRSVRPGRRKAGGEDGVTVVAKNRKASHRYEFIETFEAGLALTGNEVKSLRQGGMSIGEGYAFVRDGEVFLIDCNVARYEKTGFDTPEPLRRRKLLLTRSEIRRIASRVRQRGYTLVPVKVYFKGPWAKVEIALARGKSHSDKRAAKKESEQERHMARAKAGRSRAAAAGKSRGGTRGGTRRGTRGGTKGGRGRR